MPAEARPTGRALRVVLAPLHWLERTKGRKRLALLALYALIAAVVGVWGWRASYLVGLPDVGDPFDVEAFQASAVPDDRDGAVLYRMALAKLKTPGELGPRLIGHIDYEWSKADEPLRSWAESASSRAALETWRLGTERPDAMIDSPLRRLLRIHDLAPFWALAQLEATRLEAEGDFEGAWRWYLALIRFARHTARHGTIYERQFADMIETKVVSPKVLRWASDPRVDAPLLRRALAEAKSADAIVADEAFTLKAEYINVMRELDDPSATHYREMIDLGAWYSHVPLFGRERAFPGAAERFLCHDPELSRRALRLAFASWLAQVGQPPRPAVIQVAVEGGDRTGGMRWSVHLYDVPADAPAAARAVPPRELARRFAQTYDAKQLSSFWGGYREVRMLERNRRGEIPYLLAEALYEREHGGPPPSPEALVESGDLDALPTPDDQYVADDQAPILRDGPAPIP